METNKTSKKVERTVLDSESVEAIKKMMIQVEQELGDTVSVTQKTMVNFVIKNRSSILSAQELEQLKSENYDLIKALKHATDEAIKAKQNGSEIQLNDVIKLIQTPSVNLNSSSKKPRGRKKKENTSATFEKETKSNNGNNSQLDLSKNGDNEIQSIDSKMNKNRTTSTSDSP